MNIWGPEPGGDLKPGCLGSSLAIIIVLLLLVFLVLSHVVLSYA